MIAKVFTGFLLSLFLFNIFHNGPFLLQSTEHVLQFMIEYLSDFQSYIEGKRMEMIHSKMIADNRQRRVYTTRDEGPCPQHSYRIRIIHRKPLIIYIENFLTKKEISHLIELAEPLFKPSMTFNEYEGVHYQNEHRTSTSAYINRHQTYLVKCLERRFAQFQGGIDVQRMEPLQVVKYIENQEFKSHYDWFTNIDPNGGQRITTFFSYLQSNCSIGGETEFVDVPFNYSMHQQFCDILVCDKKSSKYGIRFRPLPGNTIFWYNVDEHGQGDEWTSHAGLPLGPNSYKIGLNTWTRTEKFYWPGDKD